MERGENMYVGLQNVNNAVDQINFNVDIDELFIRKIEFIMPTISFSVSSDGDLDYLKKIDIIEDELKSTNGISEVSVTGLPEKEIEISISEKKLLAYNLTLNEISSAVLQNNINLTGGKIEVNQNEYLLRSNNKQNSSLEIENIIVRVNENGSPFILRILQM